MEKDIASMRKEYGSRELKRSDLSSDPIKHFDFWFKEACLSQLHEPNAMTLSTLNLDGYPTSRTVLMKSFDQRGFVFYTNYTSAKAKEIERLPRAAVLFPWLVLERQVRIEGNIEKVSLKESLTYFSSRPRESQIGAWISKQSSIIDSRAFLLNQMEKIRQKFTNKEVPLPDFWGGYRVIPTRIEFWQGGKGRVHDRFLYTQNGPTWSIERLAP